MGLRIHVTNSTDTYQTAQATHTQHESRATEVEATIRSSWLAGILCKPPGSEHFDPAGLLFC